MNINGINRAQATAPIRQDVAIHRNNAAQRGAVARDEMSISAQQGAERVGAAALNSSEIRLDLVNRVRAEIAAGTYYTDEKFEIAFNRMLESFE